MNNLEDHPPQDFTNQTQFEYFGDTQGYHEHDYRSHRDNRENFRRIPTDDITKKVKVEAPEFDGSLNPSKFLDWLESMEDYFEWYNMNDAQRVRFAKMKLIGSARKYWQNVQKGIERLGQPRLSYGMR